MWDKLSQMAMFSSGDFNLSSVTSLSSGLELHEVVTVPPGEIQWVVCSFSQFVGEIDCVSHTPILFCFHIDVIRLKLVDLGFVVNLHLALVFFARCSFQLM